MQRITSESDNNACKVRKMLVGNIVAGRGVNVERLAHELLTRAST